MKKETRKKIVVQLSSKNKKGIEGMLFYFQSKEDQSEFEKCNLQGFRIFGTAQKADSSNWRIDFPVEVCYDEEDVEIDKPICFYNECKKVLKIHVDQCDLLQYANKNEWEKIVFSYISNEQITLCFSPEITYSLKNSDFFIL